MKRYFLTFKIYILISVCGLNTAVGFSQDITSGLILKYTFDNVIGTTVNDDSGNGNNGTLMGNAGITDGYAGKGAACVAKEDYINAPDNINESLSSFTFAAWIKLSSLKNATRFFDWGNGTDGTNNFISFIPSFGGDNAFMVLRFRPSSGTAYNITSTEKCPVGTWVHVTVTYNWTGTSGTGTIYLNGEAVGTNSGIPYNPSSFLGSTADNYFGYSRWSQDINGFDGIFDDIHLYDRVLTTEDINKLVFDTAQLRTDLQTLIEEAEALPNPTSDLADAIAAARNILDTATTSAELKQAIGDLQRSVYQYKLDTASAENPLDVTDLIVNPGFESSFEGWINDGMAAQTNTVFPLKEGSRYVEKWVNRGSPVPDVSVQQILPGIPNGRYRLTASAGNIQQTGSGSSVNLGDPQTGASLFAGLDKTAVDTIQDYSIEFIVVNNQVNIGFMTENATGNWVNCDNFRLLYKGFETGDIKSYLQTLVDTADSLLNHKMQDTVRAILAADVDSAELIIADQTVTKEELAGSIERLQHSILSAKISNEAYSQLQGVIDLAVEIFGDGAGNDALALNTAIEEAVAMSNNFTADLDDIYLAASDLNRAILKYHLANAAGPAPLVVTDPDFARGATMAFGRSTISGVALSGLLEHGFCWSKNPEPTVLDFRTTKYFSNNGYIYHLENLEPSTIYYIRAYAITNDYAVGYGDVIKIITLPKGTISYDIRSSATGEDRDRITKAINSAVGYWNTLTSIQGLHISAGYSSGVPTAEASYGGWMTFGSNPAYQQTGTALHEMGHTIGVGQHSIWYGPDSELRANGSRGAWLGERANEVLQFLENDPAAYMTGDAIHMWPTSPTRTCLSYGINGAQEDSGSELLYIGNSLITQALGEDGLPPTGGFATPAYTFETEDDTAYYIKSENEQTGRDVAFVVLDVSGNLANRVMTAGQALLNDSAAWKIAFNPVNSYYTIENVATGRYFTYKSSGTNGISTAARQKPVSADYFQLMKARVETSIDSLTKKGFWIVHPEAKLSPYCFGAGFTESTYATSFNLANSSTMQRWLLLSSDEVNMLVNEIDTTTTIGNTIPASKIRVYSEHQYLNIVNIESKSDILIFDLSGKLWRQDHDIVSSYSHMLPVGLYIVIVRSDQGQEVRKVFVR